MNITTTIPYSFNIFEKDINALLTSYPFLTKEIMGYSVLNKPIYCIKFGNGPKQVFYSGAIHANEWIISPMLMKFIENFCVAYKNNSTIYNYSSKEIYNSTTFYIAPMLNPDGVDLVTSNIATDSASYKQAKTISNNYPSIPFPDGWKANINGIDLNLQFPAGWKNAKQIKYTQGFISPAPRDFVGSYPLSEPESLAIYNYTVAHNFYLIIAYHTQGKEIYWQFQNYAPEISYQIGLEFAKVSNYSLANVPYESSFAGYKDWFLQEYKKPAYTIEAGYGENPLPLSQFDTIYSNNLGIMVLGGLL